MEMYEQVVMIVNDIRVSSSSRPLSVDVGYIHLHYCIVVFTQGDFLVART